MEKSQQDTTYITETEINKTTESKILNVSPNLSITGATRKRKYQPRPYNGLRRPRSDDPEKWAKYNEVHGKGVREKRVHSRTDYAKAIAETAETIVG